MLKALFNTFAYTRPSGGGGKRGGGGGAAPGGGTGAHPPAPPIDPSTLERHAGELATAEPGPQGGPSSGTAAPGKRENARSGRLEAVRSSIEGIRRLMWREAAVLLLERTRPLLVKAAGPAARHDATAEARASLARMSSWHEETLGWPGSRYRKVAEGSVTPILRDVERFVRTGGGIEEEEAALLLKAVGEAVRRLREDP
jgi:hypothetical protein